MVLAALWDLLRGERLLVHYARYEKRLLWDIFWGDYLHALPAFYVGTALAFTVFLALTRLTRARGRGWLVAIAAVLGFAAGVYLAGAWLHSAPVILATVGAALGTMMVLLLPRSVK